MTADQTPRDALWDDDMLLAICVAIQTCRVIDARLGDNILPNAKRFRDALTEHGYQITKAQPGMVSISLDSAHKINRWMISRGIAGRPADFGYDGHQELLTAIRTAVAAAQPTDAGDGA